MMCCAVLDETIVRNKVVRVQRCQNRASSTVDGYPLCGTHVNIAMSGREFEVTQRVTIDPDDAVIGREIPVSKRSVPILR